MLEVKGYEYNDKVLDFGCGHGDLSVFVKNYIGFDLRLSSIEVAKKNTHIMNFMWVMFQI